MPSNAQLSWRNDRLVRLNQVEAQCAAVLALAPPNPALADENLRGYVMLLSAHFQGFCRDLHTECVQIVTAAISPAMQIMFQRQCATGRELDGANPRYETLRKDFDRFDIDLTAELAANPANSPRVTDLGHLNAWRNYAAHHRVTPPAHGGPFLLATARGWQNSCDGLAAELDRIMYNRLMGLTGAPPW
ncbi:MAG: hypothetical protein J2P46_07055 [Zavarzinella sp.]|nr:hypothetical protein [Zavarzinella sp.]